MGRVISPRADGAECFPCSHHNMLFFSGKHRFMVHLLESGPYRPNNDSTGQLPICLSKLIPSVAETHLADRPCWQEQAHVRTRFVRVPVMEVAARRSRRSDSPREQNPSVSRCVPAVWGQRYPSGCDGLFHSVFHASPHVKGLACEGNSEEMPFRRGSMFAEMHVPRRIQRWELQSRN